MSNFFKIDFRYRLGLPLSDDNRGWDLYPSPVLCEGPGIYTVLCGGAGDCARMGWVHGLLS